MPYVIDIPDNIACRVVIEGKDAFDHVYMIVNSQEKVLVNFPNEKMGENANVMRNFKFKNCAYILDIPKGSSGEGLNAEKMSNFAKDLQAIIDFRKTYFKARLEFVDQYSQNFHSKKQLEIASDIGKFRDFIGQFSLKMGGGDKVEKSLEKTFNQFFENKSFRNQQKFAPHGLTKTAILDSLYKKPIRFPVNRILFDVNFCCTDAVALTLSSGGSQAIAKDYRLVSGRYLFRSHHLVQYLYKIEKKLKIQAILTPHIKQSVSLARAGQYGKDIQYVDEDMNGLPVHENVRVKREKQKLVSQNTDKIAKPYSTRITYKTNGYVTGAATLGVAIGGPVLIALAIDCAFPNTHHSKKEGVNAGLAVLGGLWIKRSAYYQATKQMPFYNTSYIAGQTSNLVKDTEHLARKTYRAGRTTFRAVRPLITKKTALVVGGAAGVYTVVSAKPNNPSFYKKGSYHQSFGTMNDLTGNTLMAGFLAPLHWSAHKMASWRLYSRSVKSMKGLLAPR